MNISIPALYKAASAALLAVFLLSGCNRVRVGQGAETLKREKDSYEERLTPEEPSKRQTESLPIVEVDLDKPDKGKPHAKKRNKKSPTPEAE